MYKSIKSAFLIAAVALLGACSQIDTGNVGVESTLGQVKQKTMQPDWYFTLFKTVTEVRGTKESLIQINDLKPITSDKITLNDLDLDLYVQINPEKAPAIMTRWPGDLNAVKDEGCTRVGLNYVTKQAREAAYNAVAGFGSATTHTERVALVSKLVKALQKDLDESAGAGWFTVVSGNIRSLTTDPALEANIRATANAQFELQKETNLLAVTKVQADRKRADAQGEADAIRIKAEAVSKQGGDSYVALEALKKWDGHLPTTMLPGSTLPFIPVK